MAINTWINVTLDPNVSAVVDRTAHFHSASGGTAQAGDVSMAFDSAKVTRLSILDSAYDIIRKRAASAGLK